MSDKQKTIEKVTHKHSVVDNTTLFGRLLYNIGIVVLFVVGYLVYQFYAFMKVWGWWVLGGCVLLVLIWLYLRKKNPLWWQNFSSRLRIVRKKPVMIQEDIPEPKSEPAPVDPVSQSTQKHDANRVSSPYTDSSWRPQYESSY